MRLNIEETENGPLKIGETQHKGNTHTHTHTPHPHTHVCVYLKQVTPKIGQTQSRRGSLKTEYGTDYKWQTENGREIKWLKIGKTRYRSDSTTQERFKIGETQNRKDFEQKRLKKVRNRKDSKQNGSKQKRFSIGQT